MSLQNNPYEELLKYLEDESPSVKKEDTSSKSDSIKETPLSLEGIYSDVFYKQSNVPSRGFDVNTFESLMRDKLIDEYNKRQSYERPYISVTELFKCLRQSYYARKNYKINVVKQFDFSYLYMINIVGNTIHDIIQELYDHTEVEKTIISEKYKVKGRIDGIKNNIVLEYKTIDEAKFTGKYILDHYYQGLIYAYILNSEYNYKIDTITIVYIMRNLKRIVPFDLPIDDKQAIQFLNNGPLLKNCIDKNIIPETINSTPEQCQWCQYKSYCDKEKSSTNKVSKNKPIFQM